MVISIITSTLFPVHAMQQRSSAGGLLSTPNFCSSQTRAVATHAGIGQDPRLLQFAGLDQPRHTIYLEPYKGLYRAMLFKVGGTAPLGAVAQFWGALRENLENGGR